MTYQLKKTFIKTFKELLIWGIPQAVVFVSGTSLGKISIAGAISIVAKIGIDFLKHNNNK